MENKTPEELRLEEELKKVRAELEALKTQTSLEQSLMARPGFRASSDVVFLPKNIDS